MMRFLRFGSVRKRTRRAPSRSEQTIAELRVALAESQAETEAERRRLRVAEAEIEALAGVIARDRARVEAETAGYARRQAESEAGIVQRD